MHGGDGRIRLISKKNGKIFTGRYRTGAGVYTPQAMQRIHGVFGADYDPHKLRISLRLIEFVDFLEDHFRPGAWVTVTSGYRSPQYNSNLRQKGALAAKASLHQYGMALDLILEGVPAKDIWEYVRELQFGGAGYYHGQTVHIDVGPARSWDETTSGVGTGISDDNKLIGLVTAFDRYLPGETLELRFIRMTAFPIGVNSGFELISLAQGQTPVPVTRFVPQLPSPAANPCPAFKDIDGMDGFRWTLPGDLPPGRYAVRARFCENPWNKMPEQVTTPAFEVLPAD